MIKHYIIMSSSYSSGTRIALDITVGSMLNSAYIEKTVQYIKDVCGEDVPLSTHLIETDSDSWVSIKEYDPFFEDVICTKDVKAFSEHIKKDRVLSGLDVAAYILSKKKCTHLALEKLVYMAYADYLCKYGERLFEDKIYAFSYGPIVDSVYQTYKKSGYDHITPPQEAIDTDTDINSETKVLPAKSRILFAQNGAEKLSSIDKTIAKYGHFSARALVDITHRKGSPWDRTDSTKMYQIISDETIKAYHHIEE